MTNKLILKLATDIASEHFVMTKDIDNNMNYLWWMYTSGPKKGAYKPFILLFETKLLKGLNIITEDEEKSIETMLISEDEDNTYLAACSIKHLRNQRVKTYGTYNKPESITDQLKDLVSHYTEKVVVPQLISKA